MQPAGFPDIGGIGRKGEAIKDCVLCLVVTFYIALTLVPLISSGYYSDDLVNANLRGHIQLQGTSFLKVFSDVNREWIRENGRLFPVGLLVTHTVIYFSDGLLLYKHLLLGLVLASALAFGCLVRLVTGDRNLSLLSLLALPVFFQFRLYHSPILSFSGLVPIFLFLTCWALIFFAMYLRTSGRKHLALSLIFYTLTLYFSEISLLLIVLFWILADDAFPDRPLRYRLGKMAPLLASWALAVALTIVVKLARDPSSATYDGIQTGFELVRLAKTFLKQSFAMIPLSYYLGMGNRFQLFAYDIPSICRNVTIIDGIVVAVFVTGYLLAIRRLTAADKAGLLIRLGLPLVVFPALLVALSVKYQQSLKGQVAGVGYIYVYIQYFGAALIFTGLFLLLVRRFARSGMAPAMHGLIIVVTSVVLLLNGQNNRIVVDKANADLHFQREALKLSLENRILRDVPENSPLLVLDKYVYDPYPGVDSDLELWGEGYPWISDDLIYQYSGKRMRVFTSVAQVAEARKKSGHPEAGGSICYALIIRSFPDGMNIKEGYVELVTLDASDDPTGKAGSFRPRVLRTYLPNNIEFPGRNSSMRPHQASCDPPLPGYGPERLRL